MICDCYRVDRVQDCKPKNVEPKIKKNAKRITLKPMLRLDSHFTPLPSPESAESVATPTITTSATIIAAADDFPSVLINQSPIPTRCILDTNCSTPNPSHSADNTPGTDRGSYSFSIYEDHPSGHRVTQLDPYAIRPSNSKIYALSRPEKFGKSTRQIMLDLGYSESDIEAGIASGSLSDSWGDEFLPS